MSLSEKQKVCSPRTSARRWYCRPGRMTRIQPSIAAYTRDPTNRTTATTPYANNAAATAPINARTVTTAITFAPHRAQVNRRTPERKSARVSRKVTQERAAVSGSVTPLYRRFTVRRQAGRHQRTAAAGQRRDQAAANQQAAHTEDDPGDAEQVGEAARHQDGNGDRSVDHREHRAEDADAQFRFRLFLQDREGRDEEHAEFQATDEPEDPREGNKQPL